MYMLWGTSTRFIGTFGNESGAVDSSLGSIIMIGFQKSVKRVN